MDCMGCMGCVVCTLASLIDPMGTCKMMDVATGNTVITLDASQVFLPFFLLR